MLLLAKASGFFKGKFYPHCNGIVTAFFLYASLFRLLLLSSWRILFPLHQICNLFSSLIEVGWLTIGCFFVSQIVRIILLRLCNNNMNIIMAACTMMSRGKLFSGFQVSAETYRLICWDQWSKIDPDWSWCVCCIHKLPLEYPKLIPIAGPPKLGPMEVSVHYFSNFLLKIKCRISTQRDLI